MFAGGLREMQQTEIPIHGVTHTAMTKLLDFIYTSELDLDLDTVQEVLCAATLLQVKHSACSSVSASNHQGASKDMLDMPSVYFTLFLITHLKSSPDHAFM